MKRKPNSTNTNQKSSKPSTKQKSQYLCDEKYVEEKLITKYLKKGFESLSIEELALTIISPTFESAFHSKTGSHWPKENKSKAIERLNFAKFNIQWNTSMNKKSNTGLLKSPYGVLFDLCEKGDTQHVIEYFKKHSQNMHEILTTVDTNKKSLLHIAAKCGDVTLINVLINHGFSVYLRDKFLRTPLHVACQFGKEKCFDELIKAKSDIFAKDSIGRTCLHYACFADCVNVVTMILDMDPDMLQCKDAYGRTPLHYAVWNGTNAQSEIINKLIEAKVDVNVVDDENMTPLHFAADAGKGKIIPLLLKAGANPFLRDGRTHQTSLELACNDRIKEIIIVYSGVQYQSQMNDMKLIGEKINLTNKEEYLNGKEENEENAANINNTHNGMYRQGINRYLARNSNGGEGMRQNKSKSNLRISKNEDIMDDNEGVDINNEHAKAKKKLVSFLKSIQKFGYESRQDSARPDLYSYEWLKTINNIDSFYKHLNELTAPEAVLIMYNILFPYQQKEKPLREEDIQDTDFMRFYNSSENITKLKEQSKELIELQCHLNELTQRFDNGNGNLNVNSNEQLESYKLKYDIEIFQNENNALKDKINLLIKENESLSNKIKEYELKQYEFQTSKLIEKDKIIENLLKELSTINQRYEKVKEAHLKEINTLASNGTTQQQSTLTPTFLGSPLTLQEENSIYIFLKLTQEEGLNKLISRHDRDKDLHLLKDEFISIFDEINLPHEHRNAVIKLSGFQAKQKLSIKKLVDAFYKRSEEKNKRLNAVLYNFIYKLNDDGKSIEELNKDLTANNKRNVITIKQFKQICKRNEFEINDIENFITSWDFGEENNVNESTMVIDIGMFCEKLKKRKEIIDNLCNMQNRQVIKVRDENEHRKTVLSEVRQTVRNVKGKGSQRIVNDDNNEGENIQKDVLGSHRHDESNNISKFGIAHSKLNSQNLNNPNKSLHLSKNDSNFQNDNSNIQNINKSFLSNKSQNISNIPLNESKDQTVGLQTNRKPARTQLNPKEKINGELKIQVKNINNLILNNKFKSPYVFSLALSINGIDKECLSKEIITSDLKSITFNWATRVLLKNKTLNHLSVNCVLVFNVVSNRSNIPLGECSFDWTKCLIKDNWDKYVIDDTFKFVNNKKISFCDIIVQAKYIPFGSRTSNFDERGRKKNSIGNVMKSLTNEGTVEKNEEQIQNNNEENQEHNEEHQNNEEKEQNDEEEENQDNEEKHEHNEEDQEHHEEEHQDNEEKEHNDEEEEIPHEEENHLLQQEEEQNPENEKEEQINDDENEENKNEEGMTFIKEIEAEITNVVDRDKFVSHNYYIAVFDIENNEIFSSKDETSFQDMLTNLPYIFNFSVYITDKDDTFSFELHLKNYDDDYTIASVPVIFNAKDNHLEKIDKFDLTGDTEPNPITFYMKYIVNTVENE